jgi:calcineurin-like phosphoesterase family protein
MNEAIIHNFNTRLRPGDVLYILGDFTLGSRLVRVAQLFNTIKCKDIRIIPGNHDREWLKKYSNFLEKDESDPNITILKDIETLKYKDYTFTLCHYPIERWYQCHRDNSLHLHGHTHNTARVIPKRWDVGVDANNFQLVSIEEVISKYLEQKINK